jgi:predicted metal-dependent hydrolase
MNSALNQRQAVFEEGIRLFNTEQYWHAHEAWEVCWRAAGEPEATLYKGLIQTAAALVHWQRGNPRGLRLNWAKARPRLLATSDIMAGLDVPALIGGMDVLVKAEGNGAPPILKEVPNLSSLS